MRIKDFLEEVKGFFELAVKLPPKEEIQCHITRRDVAELESMGLVRVYYKYDFMKKTYRATLFRPVLIRYVLLKDGQLLYVEGDGYWGPGTPVEDYEEEEVY